MKLCLDSLVVPQVGLKPRRSPGGKGKDGQTRTAFPDGAPDSLVVPQVRLASLCIQECLRMSAPATVEGCITCPRLETCRSCGSAAPGHPGPDPPALPAGPGSLGLPGQRASGRWPAHSRLSCSACYVGSIHVSTSFQPVTVPAAGLGCPGLPGQLSGGLHTEPSLLKHSTCGREEPAAKNLGWSCLSTGILELPVLCGCWYEGVGFGAMEHCYADVQAGDVAVTAGRFAVFGLHLLHVMTCWAEHASPEHTAAQSVEADTCRCYKLEWFDPTFRQGRVQEAPKDWWCQQGETHTPEPPSSPESAKSPPGPRRPAGCRADPPKERTFPHV